MHHIVMDGWSVGVLCHELQVLYPCCRDGQPSPLAELAVQVCDVAAWAREQFSSQVLEHQLAYWLSKLDGYRPLEFPTDYPRPVSFSGHGGSLPVRIPPSLAAALRQLSRQQGATLFMTLMTAWSALLFRYSGQGDMCICFPIAHRTRIELEPLIGLFTNTLVLILHVEGTDSFPTLAAKVRQACLEADEHKDVPFEKLADELLAPRGLDRTSFFKTMFVLQNTPVAPGGIAGLELELIEVAKTMVEFELTLDLQEGADGSVTGSLAYARDLWQVETMLRLVDDFSDVLTRMVGSPKDRMSELSFGKAVS
jgi:hypothetical protein